MTAFGKEESLEVLEMGRHEDSVYLITFVLACLTCIFFFIFQMIPSTYAQFLFPDFGIGGFGFLGAGLGLSPFQGLLGPPLGGFSATPNFFGFPFQGPGFNLTLTGIPYAFPLQNPGSNFPIPGSFNPFYPSTQPSSDKSSSNTGFNIFNPEYNSDIFNPGTALFGPSSIPQTSWFSSLSPLPGFSSLGSDSSSQSIYPFRTAFGNPLSNAFNLFSGTFPNGTIPGFGPFRAINPWGLNPQFYLNNPWQPWNPGNNPNLNPYYPNSGGNGNDNDEGDNSGINTNDNPDIRGYWSGTWESYETDPNGLKTDPNAQIIIVMSGDISLHITQQVLSGGALIGTIDITGWNVNTEPAWTGEDDNVELKGWIDLNTKYLKANYFYYDGKEDSGDYDPSIDPNEILEKLKGFYSWIFYNLNISENGIQGQFTIAGPNNYNMIGAFKTGKYQP